MVKHHNCPIDIPKVLGLRVYPCKGHPGVRDPKTVSPMTAEHVNLIGIHAQRIPFLAWPNYRFECPGTSSSRAAAVFVTARQVSTGILSYFRNIVPALSPNVDSDTTLSKYEISHARWGMFPLVFTYSVTPTHPLSRYRFTVEFRLSPVALTALACQTPSQTVQAVF